MHAHLKAIFFLNFSLQPLIHKPTEEDMQDAKIIYFYPSNIPINDLRTHVAITEGYTLFFGMFKPVSSKEVITSSDYSITISLEVEPKIWISAVYLNSTIADTSKAAANLAEIESSPFSDPHYYKNVTMNLYQMVKLFYGPIATLSADIVGSDFLRPLMDPFISDYMKYFLRENDKMSTFFTNYNGLWYCPIEKKLFLKISSFISQTCEKYRLIRRYALFYKGYFINSNIALPILKNIYKYIVNTNEIKSSPYTFTAFSNPENIKLLSELNNKKSSVHSSSNSMVDMMGNEIGFAKVFSNKKGFITGPVIENVVNPLNVGSIPFYAPKVYVECDDTFYYLVMHNYEGFLVCLFVDIKEALESNEYYSLSASLIKGSSKLEEGIRKELQKYIDHIDKHGYFYHNNMNFALKMSSIITEPLYSDAYKILLNNIQGLMSNKAKDALQEYITRTDKQWIIAYKSFERIVFIFSQNTLKLKEALEEKEVTKQKFFKNIVII